MRTIAFICCLLVAPVAVAGDSAGVVVTGDVTLQPRLAAALEAWLQAHGDEVVASALPADAVRTLTECVAREAEACAAQVIDASARARVVVVARADTTASADGSRSVALTAHRFTKGGESTADRRFCERCTDAALATIAAELMTALATSAHSATGSLRLASMPAGATIMIDGTSIGITPLVHELAAGSHDVTFVLDGHDVESRTVNIRAGETATLEVQLGGADAPPVHSRSVLPAVLSIGGLAIGGAGIALIAIDEDASPTGPPEIRNTAPAGVALAAAGGLALAVGVWLWLREGPTSSAPVAALSHDAAVIGWSHRF